MKSDQGMKQEFKEQNQLYYEAKLKSLMHEPGQVQKRLRDEILPIIDKKQIPITTMDCMYLISQIIAQNSHNFLSEAMKRKKFDAGCLQSSLAVMQKGQTFNTLYKLLQKIDKFGDIFV